MLPLAIIVAVSRNGIIGRDGAIPWRLPSDLKHFRRMTMGKPMIMGRKQYATVGKPLDGRDNIVLTREVGFTAPGVLVAHTLPAAIRLAEACAHQRGANEIMIIGGGEIYRLALPQVTRVYLTEIHAEVPAQPGDITFPALAPQHWRAVARAPLVTGERDQFSAELVTLQRI